MKISRRTRRVTAVVASMAVGIGALTGCATPGTAANDEHKLVIASPAPNSLFTFNEAVANKLGFYDDEGIDVELVAISDAIPVSGLVQNRQVDAALIAASDALAAASKTDELRLPYDERTGGSDFIYGIVVPEESGITSLSELAGTNIGLASPDQDLALLASALPEVGLTLDDVKTTVVGAGGPSVAESLKSGRISAFVGTIADFAAFGDAGLEVENVIPDGLQGLPVGGYIMRADALAADDDLIKFLRAIAKGTFVALERPEVARLVTQEIDPETWREPELAQFLLDGLSETLVPYDTDFGVVDKDRWQDAQDLLVEVGAIADPSDIDDFLVTDLIDQINDWDRDEVLAQADAWLEKNQ